MEKTKEHTKSYFERLNEEKDRIRADFKKNNRLINDSKVEFMAAQNLMTKNKDGWQ